MQPQTLERDRQHLVIYVNALHDSLCGDLLDKESRRAVHEPTILGLELLQLFSRKGLAYCELQHTQQI